MKTSRLLFFVCLTGVFLLILHSTAKSQDSTVTLFNKVITLKEVVVRNKLNVPDFIRRIQKDTTFYKAFKNLRVLGFTALNDIRMLDKNQQVKASLQSKTRQSVSKGCRSIELLEEHTSGNIFDRQRNWNYYTAEMYASLFFSSGVICGENNIVQGAKPAPGSRNGMAKRKEQLKMLMFNPGSRIPGIPFVGNKVAIFEDKQAALYNFTIDMDDYKGQNCYTFYISARENLTRSEKDQVVINKLTTWFNSQTMEIVARDYDLSYDAGVYDFDVQMQVELEKFGDYLVPKLIRYTGNWHAMFTKREQGVFTATLFDFRK